jgi:hypothetical protein
MEVSAPPTLSLKKQPLLPTEQDDMLGPRAHSCFREGKHLLHIFKPQFLSCPCHRLATIPTHISHLSVNFFMLHRKQFFSLWTCLAGFCDLDLSCNLNFWGREYGAYCAVVGAHAGKKAGHKRDNGRMTLFASFLIAEICKFVCALRRE